MLTELLQKKETSSEKIIDYKKKAKEFKFTDTITIRNIVDLLDDLNQRLLALENNK